MTEPRYIRLKVYMTWSWNIIKKCFKEVIALRKDSTEQMNQLPFLVFSKKNRISKPFGMPHVEWEFACSLMTDKTWGEIGGFIWLFFFFFAFTISDTELLIKHLILSFLPLSKRLFISIRLLGVLCQAITLPEGFQSLRN